MTIQQAFDLALQLHQANRLSEAESLYRQIITQQPNHPEALHFLGIIACQTGRNGVGVELLRLAISHRPNWAEAYYNLGKACFDDYQLDAAVAAYRQAIRINPNLPDACNNLGSALRDLGRLDEALAAYRQAVGLNPKFADAYSNLGITLTDIGLYDEAIAACCQAVALKPGCVEALFDLGNSLSADDRWHEAAAAYRQAIAIDPDCAEAHSNLGSALLKGTAQPAEAIAACRRAIELDADFADAHHNLALMLLLQGDYVEGWKEHEWRWQVNETPSPNEVYSQPQWDGSDLNGRTLLLYAEQGVGDTIQFIRYVPLIAKQGGKILVSCQPQLHPLFRSVSGVEQWFSPHEPAPQFDVHCPLLSLPLAFGTTLQTIPIFVPYLMAIPEEADRWRQRLDEYVVARRFAASPSGEQHTLKVGLAWAGSPGHTNDRNRSIPLSSFAALAHVPGVTFYSLQVGPAGKQAKDPPAGMNLIDWTDDLHDFADTAALIDNLDLVISVDTAVVHLAGAMGKTVWTLVPFSPDWRWLLDRADTPWYPTMRLFRQPRTGDWNRVVAHVADALHGYAAGRVGILAHRV